MAWKVDRVSGDGSHSVALIYRKDGSADRNADCAYVALPPEVMII